mgnify:CR=1 FL=1
MMEIAPCAGTHDEKSIPLILKIQNQEAKINLSLAGQPDLKDIRTYYQKNGYKF